MAHSEIYKGRTINVSISKRVRGYTWSYMIQPDMIFGDCGDRPLDSEEIMLQEAIHDAKFRIDHLPPLSEKPLDT